MTIKNALQERAAGAFAAGTAGKGAPISDQLTQAKADANAAKTELQAATLRANAITAAAEAGIRTGAELHAVGDAVVQAYRDSLARSEPFSFADAAKAAIYDAKTKGGETPLAHVPSGATPMHPGGATPPRTFQDVQRDRAAYRAKLRELGLTDPATQSYAGDGGLHGGDPLGGR